MNVFHLPRWRGIVGVCVAFVALAADAQSWSRDWGQPVSMPGYIADRIVPDGAGEFLIAGDGSFGSGSTPLQRVRADGSTRWLSIVHGRDYGRVVDAIADADGSALVLRTDYGEAIVARVDAAGTLAWVRRLNARRMVVLDADRVAVFGCNYPDASVLTTLARADGRVLDQHAIAIEDGGCNAVGLGVDGSGGVIAAQGYGDMLPTSPMRVSRFDANGGTTWRTEIASAYAMPAVRGANAYFTTPDRLQAVAVASGLPMWSADCAAGATLRFVDDDPLCVLPDGRLVRLRAATGQVAWTGEPGLGVAVAVVEGNVYFVRGETLSRVRGSDGALVWSAATGTVYAPHHVFLAGADGNIVRIVMPTQFPGESTRIDRYAAANGASLGIQPVERVAPSAQGFVTSRDGDDVFALGYADELHLRRLAAADGALIWDIALTSALRGWSSFAVSADAVVVVTPMTTANRVWRFDRATGALAWQADLDVGAVLEPVPTLATPAIATDGSVYVATAYNEGGAMRHYIYKLSHADGGVVWRTDASDFAATGPTGSALTLAAVGGGVVAGLGEGYERPPAGLFRLADADGSIVWTSATAGLDEGAMYTLGSDGALYGFGTNAANDAVLTKIDVAAGTVIWQRTYHEDDATFWPYIGEVLILPGGDVLFGGLSSPVDGLSSDRLVRVTADGSSIERVWSGRQQFALATRLIGLGDDGYGWGDTRQGNLHVLRRFDFARRKFVAHRVFGPLASHEFDERREFAVRGAPVGGRMLADAWTKPVGAMPVASVAMLDLASSASGDLAVTMSRFAADTPIGTGVPFVIGVRYVGDAPLDGVRVLAKLPWTGTPSPLACAGQGVTRCEVAERGDWIDARMDLVPGASVEITGAITALWFAPSWLEPVPAAEAVVFGPMGFEEANIDNNLSNGDALFLGDFD